MPRMAYSTCHALLSGDMSQPVYRYLAEQAWRNDGSLGILVRDCLSRARRLRYVLSHADTNRSNRTDAAPHADARHHRSPRYF